MRSFRLSALGATLWALVSSLMPIEPVVAQPRDKVGDEASRALLTQMHTHLATASELQFSASMVVSSSLRESKLHATAEFFLKRPNQLRVEMSSGHRSYNVISDGKRLTIYKPQARRYAQFAARDSMLGSMYTAAGLMNIAGRMLDFFWAVSANTDLSITSLPPLNIEGRECRGIRVERFEEVFDVWIAPSGAPLPCKLVNHRTDGSASVGQTTLFSWRQPAFDASTFTFVPPNGSRQVDPIDLE